MKVGEGMEVKAAKRSKKWDRRQELENEKNGRRWGKNQRTQLHMRLCLHKLGIPIFQGMKSC